MGSMQIVERVKTQINLTRKPTTGKKERALPTNTTSPKKPTKSHALNQEFALLAAKVKQEIASGATMLSWYLEILGLDIDIPPTNLVLMRAPSKSSMGPFMSNIAAKN